MKKQKSIGVLGAGSWGTALARLLALNGHKVTLWGYERDVVDGINSMHRNPQYLTDIDLPKTLLATYDANEAALDKNFIVVVTPSHVIRNVLSNIKNSISSDTHLVSCSKGIELESGKLVSEVIAECLPNHPDNKLAFLSGPSFAKEVAQNHPTTVVVASKDLNTAKLIKDLFTTERFLVFTSSDIVGVEIGGAVKNVIAIAAGCAKGLGFGNNTQAALITRGLYEIAKIGKALGANPLTFAGLSGIGDLILTCTSTMSRNFTVGLQLGEGRPLQEILSQTNMVAEGIKTTKALHLLSQRLGINMPITTTMYKILYQNVPPIQAAKELMSTDISVELKSLLE
ncbi:NAD(P)H-dependent glycerol-3-phosphate dehydrogenase [bacterium]|nr:NAD(P)H-dependent glycerol-3-phosphate dehydrogenase [bacterium]